MESLIQNFFVSNGLAQSLAYPLAVAASVLILAVCTAVIGYLLKLIVVQIILRMVARTHTEWDDYLLTKEFFGRLTLVLQSLTALALLWYIIPVESPVFKLLHQIILCCLILTSTLMLFTFLSNVVNASQTPHG